MTTPYLLSIRLKRTFRGRCWIALLFIKMLLGPSLSLGFITKIISKISWSRWCCPKIQPLSLRFSKACMRKPFATLYIIKKGVSLHLGEGICEFISGVSIPTLYTLVKVIKFNFFTIYNFFEFKNIRKKMNIVLILQLLVFPRCLSNPSNIMINIIPNLSFSCNFQQIKISFFRAGKIKNSKWWISRPWLPSRSSVLWIVFSIVWNIIPKTNLVCLFLGNVIASQENFILLVT